MVWLFFYLSISGVDFDDYADDCLTGFFVLFRPQQITQLREAMNKTKEELTAKVEETEARAKTAEGV